MLRSVLECGWGSATAQLDAALVATDVITSAVEHAAAEHALVLELARPQGRFRLSVADGAAVRRIVGDRDTGTRGGPCMRLVEALPTGAPGSTTTTTTTHPDGDADRVVPLRTGRVSMVCRASRERRQGEQQRLPAVGDWFAGCTD